MAVGVTGMEKQSKEVHEERKKQQRKCKLKLANFATSYPVSDNFLKEIRRFTKLVRKADDISKLVTHVTGSIIVQHLLYVLHLRIPSLCNKLILSILKTCGKDDDMKAVPSLLANVTGSYIMEVILNIASSDMLDILYSQCFEKRVSVIAGHPQANFVLQKFLEVSNGSHIRLILKELNDLESVMYKGHYGVVVRLLQCGIQCPESQSLLIDLLMKAFHVCDHPDDCLMPLMMLTTYEIYSTQQDDNVSV